MTSGIKIHATLYEKNYEWKTCFKSDGRSIDKNFLYTKHGPTNGYSHFIWKEDNDSDQNPTSRQEVTDRINKYLPKYSSKAYKIKIKQLTSLIMEDKIKTSQLGILFQELTEDQSSSNKDCKSVDDSL